MKKNILFLLLIIPILWFGSCNKKTTELDYNPNVLSSKDYIRAEDAMFEIVNTFFKGVHDSLVEGICFGYIDDCEVCYFPDENLMTFGYGSVNRYCTDNKYRRGSFLAQFSGPVFDEGVTANLKTDNLIVDDSLVEAEMDIRYMGINSTNRPEYNLNLSYCKIKLPDSTKVNGVTISADLTLVWQEGYLTPEIHEDDTYFISGNASGISSDSYEFTVAIEDPLENYLDCFWISSGISKLTVSTGDFPTGDIDYILEDGCFNEMHFYVNENMFYDFLK